MKLSKEMLDAIAALTCALAQEFGEGDVVLKVHPSAFRAIVGPINGETGFVKYVVMAPGGKVTLEQYKP